MIQKHNKQSIISHNLLRFFLFVQYARVHFELMHVIFKYGYHLHKWCWPLGWQADHKNTFSIKIHSFTQLCCEFYNQLLSMGNATDMIMSVFSHIPVSVKLCLHPNYLITHHRLQARCWCYTAEEKTETRRPGTFLNLKISTL